jgi:hypothetical protein
MPVKKNVAVERVPKRQVSAEKLIILSVPVRLRKQCGTVSSPKEFFAELTPYMIQWLTWASEVDSCWDTTCESEAFRKELQKLCKDFAKWAADAQAWGDKVEECFQQKCVQPPDHTTPPPPPFT